MMDDIYKIPASSSEGLYKEKGSKFIAYAYPVTSVDQIQTFLEQIKKDHPKSRHVCYAYRLSPDQDIYRYNDDGEPSGTAGKPIFGQILSADVYEILVAVVRYFGGTKLGASGLIRAYKTAAEDAIINASFKKTFLSSNVSIHFSYNKMGDIMNVLKRLELNIFEKSFDINPYIILQLHRSSAIQDILNIKAMLLNRDIQDVDEATKIDGVQIKLMEE